MLEMSAQYKPYRDEESVDGLETTSWTDNEPGSIQIYEKTTEELPFNSANKKALWIQIALFILTGTLGFLLGYFGHFHPADLTNGSADRGSEPLSPQGHSSMDFLEDPSIKDKLLNQIDGNKILATLNKFADKNRLPGSAGDQEFANHVQHAFDSYGLDPISVTNYTFKTMLPKQRSIVRLLDKENKTIYSTYDHDAANNRNDDRVAFLPLSQAEETIITTNQLMYLNKGLKEDYEKLASLGLNSNDTEGKVFVIRQTFYQAHDVVINAQETGAQAVLLFPDPDTYGSTSPFPESVQLPNDAARSHPLAWSNYGDLASLNLTSSGIDVAKLGIDKESKVHIPVILISFETAKTLLLGLSGTQAPKDWNCFDFTLHIGPGYKEEYGLDTRSKIRLEFYNHETSVTTTTISGVISGAVETDRYIVLGSRRDSLNRGVLDSVSGTAVMLEIARVFGSLVKQGWRPRRTIIFNSFGAESYNLVGSSNWLESHQRVLHSRAVAYVNCDLVVTGNQTVAISASPLLYQVLYNATKEVADPNESGRAIYENWYNHHRRFKLDEIAKTKMSDMHELDEIIKNVEKDLSSTNNKDLESNAITNDSTKTPDVLGYHGNILREYKNSALSIARPKVRRLDLHSIYSPFFLYSGIPVVDVRFTGYFNAKNQTGLLEDTLPLLGTRYDNMAAVQHIDPHLKYHVGVAQVLSEILRDLSDSVFIPFNLLDYAIKLRDSFAYFENHYGKKLKDTNLELETLRLVINDFTEAVVKFHHRQDLVDPKDAMQVRKFNDQMMLLERAFLDPTNLPNYWDRKHLILAPHDGQENREGFPGLVDWITLLEGETLEANDASIFVEVLKVHYRAVIYTISNAIKIIDDVQIL